MFDQSRAKQLQQKSHTRGMLSKQFYSQEQMELQRKRRQMKYILDQQVEEKRKKKQQQKFQQERKVRKEQQQLKHYYANIDQRQKKNPSIVHNLVNQSNHPSRSNLDGNGFDPNQSRVRQYQLSIQNIRQRVNSKTTLNDNQGDIPLLPVMALSDNNYSNSHNYGSNATIQQSYNFDKKQSGNIPLLDLGEDGSVSGNQQVYKIKKKTKQSTKRQKTHQRQNFHINNHNHNQPTSVQDSRNMNVNAHLQSFGNQSNAYNNSLNQPYSPPSYQNNMRSSIQSKDQRKKTYSDQQNGPIINYNHIQSSKVSKGQYHEVTFKSPNSKEKRHTQIPQEIQQYESQNRQLKNELKKSQQAISLLIGAVRSNAKLDRFRIQAERILHSDNQSIVKQQKASKQKIQQQLMLPKLTLRHQSIMHDYMINAAKKSQKSKTFKY